MTELVTMSNVTAIASLVSEIWKDSHTDMHGLSFFLKVAQKGDRLRSVQASLSVDKPKKTGVEKTSLATETRLDKRSHWPQK